MAIVKALAYGRRRCGHVFAVIKFKTSLTLGTPTMYTVFIKTKPVLLLATLVAVSVSAKFALVAAPVHAAETAAQSATQEKELLAVLRSDAPAAEKAITCKRLAIHGSAASVADLAKLLTDPQLSSWARIALESIPGTESDAALRKATESVEGRILVGVLNSIGVRRDAGAVGLLSGRIQDKDSQVAAAASVALGRIGNAPATKALRASLAGAPAKVRSAVAEGLVLCAERLHGDGKHAEAVQIYDEVRQADVPQQRVIEATRGAILARGPDGLPLLLELFRSSDKKMFQLALGTAREFPGSEIDKSLATELAGATPDRAALIVVAMADRRETVVLSAVLKAAGQGPKEVRLAALQALGHVGDASCLPALLDAAVSADPDLSQAAKDSLAGLTGAKVDAQIIALLSSAQGDSYALLIELVGERRIDATADLLKALDHADPSVRAAALAALGETVSLGQLPVLISQATSPKHSEDAEAARAALKAASVRMPDREACAAQLATALKAAPGETKVALLDILGDVGGTNALQTLATAAKSDDPAMQDNGSRLLGKWNSVAAAPVLLDLAQTAPTPKYQTRALRGYIGLARKFAMPEPQRVAMCQKALDIASQTAERQLVLDVLKIHPSPAGLKLAIEARETPELKIAATQTALAIAEKVGNQGIDMSELLSQEGLGQVKLEIIKAQYGAGAKQKDVTALIRKHAGNTPLITLPSPSYNTSFAGDPVPGQVKQLKIEYRINGKAGTATLEENATILLPMPK